MLQRPVVVLTCLALLCSASVPAGERLSAESRVGKDPLIVVLARLDSLMSPVDSVIDLATKFGGEITPEKVEAGFAKLDEELGFSLREDLLRQLSPEPW